MKVVYPKEETVWVKHYDRDGNLRYITTSKQLRDYYFLYELKDDKFIKLGKDRSPYSLEKKYIHI